jgi:signal peptidase I
MARRYRYEYRQRKKAKELAKLQREAEREAKEGQRSDREKELREVLGWVVYILVVVCATYLIVTYVGQRTKVSGDSMEATLHNEDNLIVDKISYRFRDPKRFEIVVFPYRYQENTYYIKRIIGLPGETVQIIDGYVYIDGELLDESYGLEVIEEGRYGIAKEPVKLGEDEYFVLGDNRNCSADSREEHVGLIHKEEFIGRAWIRIWPLKSIGVVTHE